MLADPIEVDLIFSRSIEPLRPYIGREILIKIGASLCFELVDDRCFVLTDENTRWAICGDHYFIATSRACSKSEFIDRLRDAYPDCFEWLLFHPEWLR